LLDIWVKTELKDKKNSELRAPQKIFPKLVIIYLSQGLNVSSMAYVR